MPSGQRSSEERFAFLAGDGSQAAQTALDLARTGDLLWRALRAELRPQGLTASSLGALSVIAAAKEPLRMTALGEQLAFTQANVTGIVNTLEKRRLVKRKGRPGDRRVALVEATPHGKRTLNRLLPLKSGLLEKAFAGLSEEELAALRKSLLAIRMMLGNLRLAE